MAKQRVPRLNSLLQEVISDVIRNDLHHMSLINQFVSITRVEITADLSYAKVHISVIGTDAQKKEAVETLQGIAGTIARKASKKVRMYQFPRLDFMIDEALLNQLHMQDLMDKLAKEREQRTHGGS